MFYLGFFKTEFWKNERITHFLFFVSDVSESLISLKSNERYEWIAHFAHQKWAIRSGRSEEMSDWEQIAQVAHQKWANEWIAHFFELIAHSLIFGEKTSDLLGKPMSEFPALVNLPPFLCYT